MVALTIVKRIHLPGACSFTLGEEGALVLIGAQLGLRLFAAKTISEHELLSLSRTV